MGSRTPAAADCGGWEERTTWDAMECAGRCVLGCTERARLEVRVGEAIVKEKQGETLRGKLKTGVVRKSGSI